MNPALVITIRIEPVAAYDAVGVPAKIAIAGRVTRSAFNHRISWPLAYSSALIMPGPGARCLRL
jgi:hypothetical protein